MGRGSQKSDQVRSTGDPFSILGARRHSGHLIIRELEYDRSQMLEKVNAKCCSDDYVFDISFNASVWLIQASDLEIIDLSARGWASDYAANNVVEWMRTENEEIAQMFLHLDRLNDIYSDPIGLKCSINREEGLLFLKRRRPELFQDLQKRALA